MQKREQGREDRLWEKKIGEGRTNVCEYLMGGRECRKGKKKQLDSP